MTFHYKHELDPAGIPQFGLVAEQVAKVNPDLVARDEQGQPYTVCYDAVNAMLLNEFLKEHRKGEQRDRKIEELEATVSQLQAALKVQAAQIQKVSDQLGTQAAAPRVVANNWSFGHGRDSRTYLAHLAELEAQVKAAKRRAWRRTDPRGKR